MYTYLPGVTLAVFESARVIVSWHVPTATHDIVNVLAQPRSLWTFFASSETEDRRGHEVLAWQVSNHKARRIPGANRPLMQLLQLPVVECAGEDQSTDGVTWE